LAPLKSIAKPNSAIPESALGSVIPGIKSYRQNYRDRLSRRKPARAGRGIVLNPIAGGGLLVAKHTSAVQKKVRSFVGGHEAKISCLIKPLDRASESCSRHG
jgi:hypothetical protein